jgi:hypothetical protein
VLGAEEEIPDPMAGLKPPRVPDKLVPVFAAEDLSRLERACAGLREWCSWRITGDLECRVTTLGSCRSGT